MSSARSKAVGTGTALPNQSTVDAPVLKENLDPRWSSGIGQSVAVENSATAQVVSGYGWTMSHYCVGHCSSCPVTLVVKETPCCVSSFLAEHPQNRKKQQATKVSSPKPILDCFYQPTCQARFLQASLQRVFIQVVEQPTKLANGFCERCWVDCWCS